MGQPHPRSRSSLQWWSREVLTVHDSLSQHVFSRLLSISSAVFCSSSPLLCEGERNARVTEGVVRLAVARPCGERKRTSDRTVRRSIRQEPGSREACQQLTPCSDRSPVGVVVFVVLGRRGVGVGGKSKRSQERQAFVANTQQCRSLKFIWRLCTALQELRNNGCEGKLL